MSDQKPTSLQLGFIFINSSTFRLWQSFCRLREGLTGKDSAKAQKRAINTQNIKKYILAARTFQFWQRQYLLRRQAYLLLKRYLPQPLKEALRALAREIQRLLGQGVPPEIQTEWDRYFQNRPDDAIDFLNFSVISHDWRFQRPQQLARSLASQGNRVFYLESEFHHNRTESSAWIKVRQVSPNVFVVRLSAPFNYFIYQDTPSVKGVEIIFASLKKLFRQARIVNPVAKIDHPFWECLLDRLAMPTLYDAMDLHEGFAESGRAVRQKEKSLLSQTELLLVSSSFLQNKFSRFPAPRLLLHNAVDYAHFSPARNPQPRPPDLANLPGQLIGYYGAIADWLDLSLIKQLLKDYPNDSLVLIGRLQNQAVQDLAASSPNLHLLGEKPYAQLPDYLANFDACLIPFKLTKLIKATNPVKLYEYFAAGKPVVATRLPELAPYKNLLYQASNPQEFSAAVKKALTENSKQLRAKRIEIASNNTWDDRAHSLLDTLKPLLFPQISVVMLTYNNPRLTKLALDSLLKRSKYPNLEVIIVDNHSNPATVKLLKKYQALANVTLQLNRTNHGFAKGNNLGMQMSKGKYLVLLNNDVQVTPGWLERLLYRARQTGVGLVGPVTNNIGNESKINIKYDPTNRKDLETKAADYTYAHWGEDLTLSNLAAFAWMKPRLVYQQLGGLDERFGIGLFEDDDYSLRLKSMNYNLLVAEDAFVHHTGGASTNWHSPKYQKLFEANKAKFEKKWGRKWVAHRYRQGVK